MHGASELDTESEASDSDDTAEQDTTISSGPSERPVVEEKPHMHLHPATTQSRGHDRS